MSSAQLVLLTSLVAIIRGFYSCRFSAQSRQRLRYVLDFLFLLGIVALFAVYLKHRDEFSYYLQPAAAREWTQNNLGSFVFVLACAALIIGFRISFLREWNEAFQKNAFEWLDPFMTAGAIALILITYFVRTYYIPSESMEPTLQVHDYIIVEKPFLLHLFHHYPPQRRDIVVFHPPLPGETREYIKRVIGLPEETLSVHDSHVYINGVPLEEPYIKAPPNYTFGPLSIPQNNYIVFGDNRRNSEDSHAWPESGGPPHLELSRIEGRAILIFFPLNRIRILHN